jgi:hypothetical protein
MTQLYCSHISEPKSAQSLADPGIPTLHAILNPCELASHLCSILPPHWGVLRDIRINVLKHHEGSRCTVDITLQTTTGNHELIGKVYAEDRSDVYQAMKQISQSGFGPEAEFSIPRPLAFIRDLNLLVQEKVQGQLAKEIFLTGNDSERAKAAERCARWLAHFHTRAPMSGPVFLFTHELGEQCVHRKLKRAGPLSEKVGLLLKRLEGAAATLDRSEMCACHGGYCHHQIILTETRTATFDWDNHRVADPAWDVARFIINLQKLALKKLKSLKALDAVGEAFYETYTAASGFEVAKHLPFYKAVHILGRARHSLEPMVDEGLRILAEEM